MDGCECGPGLAESQGHCIPENEYLTTFAVAIPLFVFASVMCGCYNFSIFYYKAPYHGKRKKKEAVRPRITEQNIKVGMISEDGIPRPFVEALIGQSSDIRCSHWSNRGQTRAQN